MSVSTFAPTSGGIAVLKLVMFPGPDASGSANTELTVPGINWTLEVDGKLYDCSNFRDGRMRADTMHDSTVNFTTVWDAAEMPTMGTHANLRPGAVGSVKLYTDATHFFVVPVKISTVTVKNEGMENVVMNDVVALQSGQTGVAFAYPVDPS